MYAIVFGRADVYVGCRARIRTDMSDLDSIYSTRIMELAAAIPRCQPIARADGRATAHSKLCGSTITVEVALDGDHIRDYGQSVKACLLGQATASVVGREAVGSTIAEMRTVAATMRAMLKSGGPPPTGRFADLAVLAAVRDYKARHASTLLVFDALEQAIESARVASVTTS
jgi:NifU-like protein involved in Fe-S cluster formation